MKKKSSFSHLAKWKPLDCWCDEIPQRSMMLFIVINTLSKEKRKISVLPANNFSVRFMVSVVLLKLQFVESSCYLNTSAFIKIVSFWP